MVDFENKASYGVYDLKKIIALLRSPGGCPWDIEQTHKSIRRNLLEEAYEAAEAIDEGDSSHLCEELGDVLMQVVFHSDIEEKNGSFDLDGVADMACKKLIFRHPHVFGDAHAKNSGEVLTSWDKLKSAEKNHETVSDTLDSVARSLPALWRAEKVQKKAAKVGYDHAGLSEAVAALRDELCELEDAIAVSGDIEDELGDVIMSAVSVAGFLGIDPERALGRSCDKFIRRFRCVEEAAARKGFKMDELSHGELDELYSQVKTTEKL